MHVTRLGKTALALALTASLVPATLVGCGTADAAGGDPGAPEGSAESYAEILAERYDDVFPDNQVQTVRVVMDNADWRAMQSDVSAKEYYQADIWIDDELVEDVAVRTKGSSSLMSAASSKNFRAGLKVDFNLFNSARSYHGIKKLVYNNGFSDPTLMKEFLGYELMALMGLPTPRACFVDLWVNDTHLGVYTQVEAVDGYFLSENFADSDGNLYKPEIKSGALDWTEADAAAQAGGGSTSATTSTTESFNLGGGDLEEIIDRLGEDAGWIPGWTTTDGGQALTTPADVGGRGGFPGAGFARGGFMDYNTDYLTSIGLRTNENSPDYSGLYDLLAVLNSDPDKVSAEDLEKVLQVDEVLRFLAVSVALVHLDNYIGMAHNYYLYEDGGKFWIIPWDLNMSFGGFNSGLSDEQILNFFIDEPTAAEVDEYPLVAQLIDEPEYLETYRSYLRQLTEGPFSVEAMTARINEIADLIRPYVEKDTNMFFTVEDFEEGLARNLSSTGSSMQRMGGSFIGLTYFVEERTVSIAAQLSGALPASNGDGSGNGGAKGLAGVMGGGNPPGGGGLPNVQPGQQGAPGQSGNAPGGGQVPSGTTSSTVPGGQ